MAPISRETAQEARAGDLLEIEWYEMSGSVFLLVAWCGGPVGTATESNSSDYDSASVDRASLSSSTRYDASTS